MRRLKIFSPHNLISEAASVAGFKSGWTKSHGRALPELKIQYNTKPATFPPQWIRLRNFSAFESRSGRGSLVSLPPARGESNAIETLCEKKTSPFFEGHFYLKTQGLLSILTKKCKKGRLVGKNGGEGRCHEQEL